jgi:hypothetical protein
MTGLEEMRQDDANVGGAQKNVTRSYDSLVASASTGQLQYIGHIPN